MTNKWWLGAVVMMAVVAVGGIGFATYTSQAVVLGSASSGNIALAFDYGSTTPGTYALCTISGLSGNTVHVTATDLSPGDSCSATLGVINNGTLPVTSEATSPSSEVTVCTVGGQKNCIQVTDNLNVVNLNTEGSVSGVGNQVIAAGGGFYPGNYIVTISEPSGSTTQSLGASFTITFTGSVG